MGETENTYLLQGYYEIRRKLNSGERACRLLAIWFETERG